MNNDKLNSLIFSDDEINEELLDALIKAGAHEYIQNSNLEVPDTELSDAEFSKELDKRLKNYFSGIKKENRVGLDMKMDLR